MGTYYEDFRWRGPAGASWNKVNKNQFFGEKTIPLFITHPFEVNPRPEGVTVGPILHFRGSKKEKFLLALVIGFESSFSGFKFPSLYPHLK